MEILKLRLKGILVDRPQIWLCLWQGIDVIPELRIKWWNLALVSLRFKVFGKKLEEDVETKIDIILVKNPIDILINGKTWGK